MLSNKEIERRLLQGEKGIKLVENKNSALYSHSGCMKRYCPQCEGLQEYGSGGCATCGHGSGLEDIKERPKDSYTKDTKKAISLVTGEKGKSSVFGSFLFVGQFYPGDVDVMELVSHCCTVDDVVNKMEKLLKKVTRDVLDERGYYFSEVKAGTDLRYKIEVTDPQFYEKVTELYNLDLLDKNEYESIVTLYKNKNEENTILLDEYMRKKYIIRWTSNEIIRGFKDLTGGLRISLNSALHQKGHIKIDIWAPIDGRYIEVTNFFILVEGDSSNWNDVKFINIPPFDYLNNMRDQITKYASKIFFKPFKMAKRMWGLARHFKDERLLDKLTPLFQSNIARLNQINSDIETLTLMFQRINTPPYNYIERELDNFKNRWVNITYSGFNKEELNEQIDQIISNITDRKFVIHNLEDLHKNFKLLIDVLSLEYLKKVGLWPIKEKIFGGYGTPGGAEKNPYINYMRDKGTAQGYIKKGSRVIRIGSRVPETKNISDIPVENKDISTEQKRLSRRLDRKDIRRIAYSMPSIMKKYCTSIHPIEYITPLVKEELKKASEEPEIIESKSSIPVLDVDLLEELKSKYGLDLNKDLSEEYINPTARKKIKYSQ